MANLDSILFDLDGTLVDTEPAAAKVIAATFLEWGIALVPEDAHYITGKTWESAFSYLFKKYKVPMPPENAGKLLLSRYREALADGIIFVPGAVEAVLSVSSRYKLGLVSGSHRSEIRLCLKKMGVLDKFAVILGAEDYPRSKPAPDGYLKALKLLGSDPKRTLIFEDSTAGIQSALGAGAWVVGVTSTNHFGQNPGLSHFQVEDLRPVNVDWIDQLPFLKKN